MAVTSRRASGATMRLGATLGSSFGGTFNQAGRILQNFATGTKGHLGQVSREFQGLETAANLATAAIVASAGAVTNAVLGYRELEVELQQVQYLYQNAGFEAKKFADQMQTIAMRTGTTATDATQGAFRFASAGGTLQTVMQDVTVSAQIAQATNTTTEAVSRAIAQGMNLTGYTSTEFADYLVRAAQVSQTDVTGLSRYAPRLFGGGGAAGLTGAETLGMFAGATQMAGTTEEATTGLRQVFNEVVKPDSKFAKTFEETFGETISSAIEGKGASGLLDALERAFNELGPQHFIGAFGSVEAGNLGSLMVQNIDQMKQSVADVVNTSSGSVEDMWKIYQESVDYSVDVFKASATTLQQDVGEAFSGEAKAWLDTLSEILQDPDIKDALIKFAHAALAMSEPMRQIIKPMADLAATFVNFTADTQVGGVSLLELLMFGALGGRAGMRTSKTIQNLRPKPRLQTSGMGLGGTITALRGSKTVQHLKTGLNVASSAAHLGALGLYGYGMFGGDLTDEQRQALEDEATRGEFDAFVAGVRGGTSELRKLLGARHFKTLAQSTEALAGTEGDLGKMSNVFGFMTRQLGGSNMAMVLNELGISGLLPGIAEAKANEDNREALASLTDHVASQARIRSRGAAYGEYLQTHGAARFGSISPAEDAADDLGTEAFLAASPTEQINILRRQLALMEEARDQRDDIIGNTAGGGEAEYSQFDILRTRD